MTVWVEPIALDYTLLAGESLEIVATGSKSAPWFNMNACGADLAVYLEGDVHDFRVFQNGRELEYGHNRLARPELNDPPAVKK